MTFWRRSRFDELVRRQLDLFATDEAELLREAQEADDAWTTAGSDEAEELYGDYQLVVDAISDRLLEIRSTYITTLDERAAAEYAEAFGRAVRKRFGRYATLLDDLET